MQVVEVVLLLTTPTLLMMMMNVFIFNLHFNLNFRNMVRMYTSPLETARFNRFLCFLLLFLTGPRHGKATMKVSLQCKWGYSSCERILLDETLELLSNGTGREHAHWIAPKRSFLIAIFAVDFCNCLFL